jgi:hypothetical protein
MPQSPGFAVTDDVLELVDKIIGRVVKQHAPAYFDSETREDLKQDIRLHLWSHSLPRFDPGRGVKISTYAYTCGLNFLTTCIRRKARHDTQGPRNYDPAVLGDVVGSHSTGDIDARVLSACQRLAEDGAGVLTTRQTEIVRFLVDHPGVSLRQAARRLRYRRAKDLGAMMRTIRGRIMSRSLQELAGQD